MARSFSSSPAIGDIGAAVCDGVAAAPAIEERSGIASGVVLAGTGAGGGDGGIGLATGCPSVAGCPHGDADGSMGVGVAAFAGGGLEAHPQIKQGIAIKPNT